MKRYRLSLACLLLTSALLYPSALAASEPQRISGGELHSLAVLNDGTLWAWGGNQYGQIGDGTTETRYLPVQIMDQVQSASAGGRHSIALKNDGTLWAWGCNDGGRLGDGTTLDRAEPVKIMDDVAAIAGGWAHSLAVKTDGTLWAWGHNNSGQLGNGATAAKTRPVKIMDDVSDVWAGFAHSLALKNDGTLWAWGWNEQGQVGSGSKELYCLRPARILKDIRSATAGYAHSLAIGQDGALWTWGFNEYGRLGDGTTTTRRKPVKIMDEAVKAAAGWAHSLALKSDGSVWAWGWNDSGHLGDGTLENRSVPVQVPEDTFGTAMSGLKTLDIASGDNHCLVLDRDGAIWTWGSNEYGGLGDSTPGERLLPVCVLDSRGLIPHPSAVPTAAPESAAPSGHSEASAVTPSPEDTYESVTPDVPWAGSPENPAPPPDKPSFRWGPILMLPLKLWGVWPLLAVCLVLYHTRKSFRRLSFRAAFLIILGVVLANACTWVFL